MKRIIFNVIVITGCLFIGWYVKGKTSQQMPMGGKQAPVPVVFSSSVKSQSVAPVSEYIGIVEPIQAVDLKPEISGNIEKVSFEEGSMVKKGQVLFVIDSDKYEANYALKQAEVQHAQAELSVAEKEYTRMAKLFKENHISQANIEQAEAELIQAKASEQQAIANLKLAKIDLENSEIKAPISGIIGKAMFTKGNYVTAGTSILAKIVQQSPIRVAFSVSDKEYLNGKIVGKENLSIEIGLANGETLPEEITSLFVDNQVDKDTATITLYGEFKNKDDLLVAGNYVKVNITETDIGEKLVVPAQAIGEDRHGSYVFAIKDDSTVKQVRVEAGEVVGANQVIESGLNLDDKIIIEGIQKVSDGTKVKAQEVN